MTEGSLMNGLAHVNSDTWRTSRSGDVSVSWLPLTRISETGLWLGVDKEGEWVLGRLEGHVVSSTGTLPQPWLTLLDTDEPTFRKRLDEAAGRYHLPSDILQARVPIDDVLSMAFRSHSAHWAERAVRWLIERTPCAEHLELLHELMTARWASQWTRQTARRLVSAADRCRP